jgi:hypothetical protein
MLVNNKFGYPKIHIFLNYQLLSDFFVFLKISRQCFFDIFFAVQSIYITFALPIPSLSYGVMVALQFLDLPV